MVDENTSWAGAFCLFVFGLLSGTVTSLCLSLPEYRVALRICIRVFERECVGGENLTVTHCLQLLLKAQDLMPAQVSFMFPRLKIYERREPHLKWDGLVRP